MAGHTWLSLAKRAARVALLAAAFGVDCDFTSSQTPVTTDRPAACRRTFTKNNSFSLPLEVDAAMRASLSEVQLFVKTGTHDWTLHEAVSPNTRSFTCKAPADGEYQFLLVTVDQAGRHNPAEISGQSPVLRVVVDTRPPVLDAVAVLDNGAPVLRVHMIDANPDMRSIQAHVVTETGDRALSPVAGMLGSFHLVPADLSQAIRVTGIDMSGNQASRLISARELIDASPGMAAWSTAQPVALPATTTIPAPTVIATLPASKNSPATSSKVSPPNSPVAMPSSPVATPMIGNAVANYRPAATPERTDEAPGSLKQIPGMISYKIEACAPTSVGRIDITLTPERNGNASKSTEDIAPADDAKKAAGEREELRAQLAQRNRERDELNAKLAERTKEVADLRAQLAVRTQERNQLAQDLQQIPRDLQAILQRVEAQQSASGPSLSSPPAPSSPQPAPPQPTPSQPMPSQPNALPAATPLPIPLPEISNGVRRVD